MGSEVLRPNSTIQAGGGVTGAATRHEALADDSDSSSVVLSTTGEFLELGFELPTFPAGAVGFAFICRFRTSTSSAGPLATLNGGCHVDSLTGSISTNPPFSVATYSVMTPAQIPVTDEPADIRVAVYKANAQADVHPRIQEMLVTVFWVEKPELTVDAPSGTVDDTTQPTVEWTRDLDLTGGNLQSHFEVKVFTDAQYGAGGFDPATSTPTVHSGEVASSGDSWQLDDALVEDTYRAYVRIAQTVNGAKHWSDWEHSEFEVDVDLPAAPDLTLTPEPDDGRMRLDLADAGGGATTDGYEVQWSHDGGDIWTALRTPEGGGLATGDAVTLYDHEAPNGADVLYRARAFHDYSSVLAASTWTEETGQWASSDEWLKHPYDPSLSMVVKLRSYRDRRRAARQGAFHPLGRTDPIIVSDARQTATGTVIFRLDTEADQDAFDALVDTGLPLLLQVPADYESAPDRWIVLGDHDRERIVDNARVGRTFDTLPWTQVPRP